MTTKGIRILDLRNNKCVSLSEVLESIPNTPQIHWALLWFDVNPKKMEGQFLMDLCKKTKEAERGIFLPLSKLKDISAKIFQEIEILLIGCKHEENLHRYKNDEEMYEKCDIVIEMIDGHFWEIFSSNTQWINQLAKQYEQTEFLTTDFQSKDL